MDRWVIEQISRKQCLKTRLMQIRYQICVAPSNDNAGYDVLSLIGTFFNLDKNVVIINIYGALEIVNQAYSVTIIQDISTRQL